MLEWMQNAFAALWDIINSIIRFITSVIDGIINIFRILPSIISVATNSLGYLPSMLAAFAAITIAVSVIYLIVGRNTGDS